MGLYNDLTFADTPYIQQYPGLPLDTVRDVSNTLAERHYQNLSNLSQLELLAHRQKTQVLPGHQGYVDDQIGQIKNALSDVAKNGGENATAKVAAMANQYMGDSTILQSMQRRSEIQKEVDAESALRAQGKTPIRRQGERERFLSGQISPDELSQPYQSTVESYVQPVPEMEEIWKVVNPDAWYSSLSPDEQTKLSKLVGNGTITPNMDVPLFFKTVRSQGISTKKIEGMLDKAMSSYRLQPSYRQQRELLGQSEDQLKKSLFNQGLLRVFNQASPQYHQTPSSLFKEKDGEEIMYQEGLPGVGVENSWGYSVDAFNPSGEGTPVATLSETQKDEVAKYRDQGFKVDYQPPSTHGGPGGYQVRTQSGADITASPKYEQFKKDAMAAAEVFIPGAEKWDEETKDQYLKGPDAFNNLKKYQAEFESRLMNSRLIPFNNDQVKDITEHTLNNLYNRTIYDLNEGKTLQVFDNNGNVSDRFSDLIGDSDMKNFKVTGKHNPKNFNTTTAGPEFYEGLEGYIYDKKAGEYKRILISPAAGELDTYDSNVKSVLSQTYSTLGKRPGQWQTIAPKLRIRGKYIPTPEIEARELYGEQREAALEGPNGEAPSDDVRKAVLAYPNLIQAKIGNDTLLFNSYEHLSQYLINKPKK